MKNKNYNCDYYDVENNIKNNLNNQRQIEIDENLLNDDDYTTNIVQYRDHVGIYIKGIIDEVSCRDKVLIRKFIRSIEHQYKNKSMSNGIKDIYTIMGIILSGMENE